MLKDINNNMSETVQITLSQWEYDHIKDQLTEDFQAIYMAMEKEYVLQFDKDFSHYFMNLMKEIPKQPE